MVELARRYFFKRWRALPLLLLLLLMGCKRPRPAQKGLAARTSTQSSAASLSTTTAALASVKQAGAAADLLPDVERLPDGLTLVSGASAARLLARRPSTLLAEGGPPRRPRRHLRTGPTQKLSLVIDIDMQVDGRQQPVPAISAALRLAPVANTAGGWSVEVMGVVPSERALPGSASPGSASPDGETAALMRQLVGARTTLQVDEFGALNLQPLPGLVPEIGQLWASLAEAIAETVVRWPREAIGVGARWRVLQWSFRAGLPVLLQREYTLLKDGPEGVVVTQQQREVVVDSGARDGALPLEVSLRPLRGYSDGSSRLRLAAGKLFAEEVRTTMVTEATVVVIVSAVRNGMVQPPVTSSPAKWRFRQQLSIAPYVTPAVPISR